MEMRCLIGWHEWRLVFSQPHVPMGAMVRRCKRCGRHERWILYMGQRVFKAAQWRAQG